MNNRRSNCWAEQWTLAQVFYKAEQILHEQLEDDIMVMSSSQNICAIWLEQFKVKAAPGRPRFHKHFTHVSKVPVDKLQMQGLLAVTKTSISNQTAFLEGEGETTQQKNDNREVWGQNEWPKLLEIPSQDPPCLHRFIYLIYYWKWDKKQMLVCGHRGKVQTQLWKWVQQQRKAATVSVRARRERQKVHTYLTAEHNSVNCPYFTLQTKAVCY